MHHYTSLVPEPTTLTSATLEFPAGIVIVPSYEGWFNLTLNDVNGGDDIENIVIDMGQGIEFTWQRGESVTSNNDELLVENAFFESNGEVAFLNLSFMATSLFNPAESHGQFSVHITDTSGLNSISTLLDWEFNADIMLTDFGIFINDSSNIQLQEDDYLKLEEDLLIVGRVRYTAIDLPPQAGSFEVKIEVPLDLPLAVNSADDGTFFGEMNAHGSGIFRVSLEVLGEKGIVTPTISSLRLQIDDQAPLIVGSKPNFIPANTTNLSLQFDIQEQDSGISQEDILVTCKIVRGVQSVNTEIHGIAIIQSAGVISRYITNLTSTPLQEDDSLECWLTLEDLAGNHLTGAGSSQNWPITFPVIELRPDLHSSDITLVPETPIYGKETLVNITIVNLGNYTYQPFYVSLETLIHHEGELQISEIGVQEMRFLEGETTTIISFNWIPEWDGELDLIVTLDSTNLITERNENNTQNWTVSVEKTSAEKGFFISQSMLALGGLSIIAFFSIAMFLAMRAKREEDTDGEWEEVTYDGAPDQQMKGKYEDDGHEYLQWPTGSEDWWYRNNSESEWAPWEKD